MLEIQHTTVGHLSAWEVKNPENSAHLAIVPAMGTCLFNLHLPDTIGRGRKLLDNDDMLSLEANNTTFLSNKTYKNALLLPFPNRIAGGCYTFEGKKYQLTLNEPQRNNAIHGFLHNAIFEHCSTNISDTSVSLTMKYNYNGENRGFPFSFKVIITHTLKANGRFRCHTKVINNGNSNMPIGVGWHPNIYAGNNTTINTMQLQLPSPLIELEADPLTLLPTGHTKPNTNWEQPKYLAETMLDTCFQLPANTENRTHLYYDPTLSIEILTGASYRFLQVYTQPNRKAIAIEPMSCAPNAFNNGLGIAILTPKQTWEGYWEIGRCN